MPGGRSASKAEAPPDIRQITRSFSDARDEIATISSVARNPLASGTG